MKTLTHTALFAASVVVLGTMAYGQTPVMKAEIPFAFHTATGPLAAGEYTVTDHSGLSGLNVATLRNDASKHSVFALGSPLDTNATGSPAILFRCDAAGCALAAIRSSEGTISYSSPRGKSRAREAALIAVPLRAVNGD